MTPRNLSPTAISHRDFLATATTMSTFRGPRHGENHFIIRGEFDGFPLDLFDSSGSLKTVPGNSSPRYVNLQEQL